MINFSINPIIILLIGIFHTKTQGKKHHTLGEEA